MSDNISGFDFILDKTIKIESSNKIKSELLIVLDSPNISRIGDIDINVKCVVNIDHHIDNINFGDINIVNLNSCSTCEILFDIFTYNQVMLDKYISEALYAGIVSDTGNLSWGLINSDLFVKVSELFKAGIDHQKILSKILFNKSEKQTRLIGYVLKNFKYIKEKRLAYIFIDQNIYDKYDASYDDSDSVISYFKMFQDAEIYLVLKRKGNIIKGSLRSKNKDIREIASLFGGGGHKKASGFSSDLEYDKILDKIISSLGA